MEEMFKIEKKTIQRKKYAKLQRSKIYENDVRIWSVFKKRKTVQFTHDICVELRYNTNGKNDCSLLFGSWKRVFIQ